MADLWFGWFVAQFLFFLADRSMYCFTTVKNCGNRIRRGRFNAQR